ncbi:hypothetical protein LOTGIDRAFT_60665, partial [Lottia gigantea]
AVKNRHEETSTVLIDHGANVNSADQINSTPLMYSISYALTEVFKKLLEQKCDLDIPNHDGKTSLHLAALQGKSTHAKLLIESGAAINIKDDLGRGMTPLMFAIIDESPSIVQLLLESGCDV